MKKVKKENFKNDLDRVENQYTMIDLTHIIKSRWIPIKIYRR